MKHIIVTDDDRDLSSALKLILEDEGFQVQICNCLKDLNDCLSHMTPDLLILDYCLPDGESKQIITSIHQNFSLAKMPILMITARELGRQEMNQMEINGFLTKPFSIDSLLKKVHGFDEINP